MMNRTRVATSVPSLVITMAAMALTHSLVVAAEPETASDATATESLGGAADRANEQYSVPATGARPTSLKNRRRRLTADNLLTCDFDTATPIGLPTASPTAASEVDCPSTCYSNTCDYWVSSVPPARLWKPRTAAIVRGATRSGGLLSRLHFVRLRPRDRLRLDTQLGGTPSWATGPSSDHERFGYYMYVDSYGNYDTGPYTLSSPTFAECVGEVRFHYHMYNLYAYWGVMYMGTLQLEATTDGVSWTTIWTKSDDQGNSWQGANVSVATPNVIQVRWVGTTGSGYYSDMAIDDVEILSEENSNGNCIVPTLAPTTPAPTPRPTVAPTPAPTPAPTSPAPTPAPTSWSMDVTAAEAGSFWLHGETHTISWAEPTASATDASRLMLHDDRRLFSMVQHQAPFPAQLPVELRELSVVHDHAPDVWLFVRDELFYRELLRLPDDRRR